MGRSFFVDTSYFVARMWYRDPMHHRAVAWEAYALREGINFITTEAVLWELLNALSADSTRQKAMNAYRGIHSDGKMEVVEYVGSMMRDALRLYDERSDKAWGITDCLSFVVMQLRSVTEALTADHHFEQAGFSALLLREPG